VLERIQDHPANRIGELMPWEYYAIVEEQKADAETQSGA
jgi:transposase